MRLLGAYDRMRLVRDGLLPATGCPKSGQVEIWTNSVERTIKSGEALAEGLAPGCALAIGHRPMGENDPLFSPLEAKAVPYDAQAAVAAFNQETGGAAHLAAPYGEAIHTVEAVLGCRQPGRPAPCDLAADPAAVRVSADGQGADLSGAIATTSGTAEVFLMEYIEGLPLDQVGWGRASRARLSEMSRLHGLLFDVYVRSSYMAPRSAGPMGRRIEAALVAKDGPALTLLVGHDDNIAAVAALLGVHVHIDSYGYDDPPVGGGIGFEVLKDKAGQRYVRVFYQAQTLDQLRALTPLTLGQPPARQTLRVDACALDGSDVCPLAAFQALLDRRLTL
jgi:4-phytase/acid phosphatase